MSFNSAVIEIGNNADNNIDEMNNNIDDNDDDKKIPNNERTTTLYLTKYEKTKILGTRAIQISRKAPIMININNNIIGSGSGGDNNSNNDSKDPIRIAEKELYEKKIPLIIRRYLPDGYYEDWDVNELIICD